MNINQIEDKRVYAQIDLDAIIHNIFSMQKLLPERTNIMAVVKTDGYGHGAIEIAKEIETIDCIYGFATATIEEAVELRKNKVTKPILILGYVFEADYQQLLDYNLCATVFSQESGIALAKAASKKGKQMSVHIKIDTGMSRIGFQATKEEANKIAEICTLKGLIPTGLFTHFAKADETDVGHSLKQLEQFEKMVDYLIDLGITFPFLHCANSAAILKLPMAHFNLVRSGITMYGLWPSLDIDQSSIDLKPALSLYSHIVQIKELEPGRTVSYGGTYQLEKKEVIGTIPVGYGDGYPRSLSNQGYVIVRGKKAPIRGRICMDQFMIDLSDIPDAQINDRVTLIGEEKEQVITLEELAVLSGRFNYELACCLNKRIPRIYTKENRPVNRTFYYDHS